MALFLTVKFNWRFIATVAVVLGMFSIGSACAADDATAAKPEAKASPPQATDAPAEAPSGDEAKDTKSKGKGDGAIFGGRFKGDNIYVHIEPLVLPIITDNGAEQLVTVLIDLQVRNFDAADNVHSNMPRVRDAIMQALYGGLADGALRTGNMLNIPKVKNRISSSIEKALGPNLVDDVLIQAIAQRKL